MTDGKQSNVQQYKIAQVQAVIKQMRSRLLSWQDPAPYVNGRGGPSQHTPTTNYQRSHGHKTEQQADPYPQDATGTRVNIWQGVWICILAAPCWRAYFKHMENQPQCKQHINSCVFYILGSLDIITTKQSPKKSKWYCPRPRRPHTFPPDAGFRAVLLRKCDFPCLQTSYLATWGQSQTSET